MKKRNSLYKWIVLSVILAGCFFAVIRMQRGVEADKQAREKRFTMEVKTGQNENIKKCREFLSTVTVTNHGADFAGYIQVVFSTVEYNGSYAYQFDFTIAEGETKVVSLPLRTENLLRKYTIRITDEEENVFEKVRTKINVYDYDQEVLGVLSTETGELGYLDMKKSRKIFYLNEKSFPKQWEGLGIFDGILIDNYDTSKLSEKQYFALKQWVEQGGTLYLGTGEKVNQVMGIFQDDFLTGKFGEVNKEGVASLTIEEGDKHKITIGTRKQNMYQIKREQGSVCVFDRKLAVEKNLWKKDGKDYLEIYDEYLSEEIKKELGMYSNGGGTYPDYIMLDKEDFPKLLPIIVVLIIYCLVISFGIYYVLKKKDCLELTRKMVVVLSFLCFVIIYIMGSNNRKSDPFVQYRSIIEYLNTNGDSVEQYTHMIVTSPENEDYSIAVPENVMVKSETSMEDWYEQEYTDYDSYNIKFQKDRKQQIVSFKAKKIFESYTLEAKEEISQEGNCSSDVQCENYEYSGTFTNNLGMDIKNAVFVADNKVYQIGNIKNGDTIMISEQLKHAVFAETRELSEKELGSLFGVYLSNEGEETSEFTRYDSALLQYLDQNGWLGMTEPKILGLAEQKNMDETMIKKWGMDCTGTTLCVIPINVNYTQKNGEVFIPDVLNKGTLITGVYYGIYNNMYGDISFEVEIGKQKELTGLYMDTLSDSCNGKGKRKDYKGKIKIYNVRTKEYDVVLSNTVKSCTENLENYVDEDGKIRFWYVDSCKNTEKSNYVPQISATIK